MLVESLERPKITTKENRRSDFNFHSVAKDVATLGVGTLFATVFGTVQVFLIPRVVSVENFGYWRLFLLYNSFVGLLHLGFLDGALLRWGGKEFDSIRREIRSSFKFLAFQQLAVLAFSGVVAITLLPSRLRPIGIGLVVYAAIFNFATLFQYSLQAARKFKQVAVASALPMGVFLGLVVLWIPIATPDAAVLIGLFVVAWFCTLIFYGVQIRPFSQSASAPSDGIGWRLLALGWPIVLSNTVYGLVQTIDRLAVSSIFTIREFAQYSFAASTLFVPIAMITAGAQVFFPHIAATQEERRFKAYSFGSLLLIIGWGFCLPYYFVLQLFVRHFLPKYQASLSVAAVLMFGVIFLAGIQILQSSFFNIYGMQRKFLRNSIVALSLGAGLVLGAALHFKSLEAVAAAQVLTFAFWWVFNEWKLRSMTKLPALEWMRRAGLFSWAVLIFWAATQIGSNTAFRLVTFYGLLIIGFVSLCPREAKLVSRRVWQFQT